jgi:hypothetical protein
LSHSANSSFCVRIVITSADVEIMMGIAENIANRKSLLLKYESSSPSVIPAFGGMTEYLKFTGNGVLTKALWRDILGLLQGPREENYLIIVLSVSNKRTPESDRCIM